MGFYSLLLAHKQDDAQQGKEHKIDTKKKHHKNINRTQCASHAASFSSAQFSFDENER